MRACILVVIAISGMARAEPAPELPGPMMKSGSSPTADGGTATIAARVLKNGKPVAFYGLIIEQHPSPYAEQPITIRNASGRFRFRAVKTGAWKVVIVGPGFARTTRSVTFTDAKDNDLGDITVDAGLRVTGHVIDGSSRPATGATVATVDQRGGMSLGGMTVDGKPLADPVLMAASKGEQSTTVDARGNYVLEGVPAGSSLHVEVSLGSDRASQPLPAGPGPVRVDLVLGSAGGIDGVVEGKTTASVIALIAGKLRQVHPAADGTFRIDNLQPGDVTLSLWMLGDKLTNPPITVTVPLNRRVKATLARARTLVTLEIRPTSPAKCMPFVLMVRNLVPDRSGSMPPLGDLAIANCTSGTPTLDAPPGKYLACRFGGRPCKEIEILGTAPTQTLVLDLK